MTQARFEIGENLVIVENEDGQGDGLIRNTATGAEIKLGDFVDVAGAIGSESDPVSEGFFESVETESATVTNEVDAGSVSTESATVTNEVDAGSVSTESATVTNEVDAGSVNTEELQSENLFQWEPVDSFSADNSTFDETVDVSDYQAVRLFGIAGIAGSPENIFRVQIEDIDEGEEYENTRRNGTSFTSSNENYWEVGVPSSTVDRNAGVFDYTIAVNSPSVDLRYATISGHGANDTALVKGSLEIEDAAFDYDTIRLFHSRSNASLRMTVMGCDWRQ